MKKLNINQLDEKQEEIADALISLGLGRLVARTLAYLNNGEEATSVALEMGAGMRQPEVSIAMRELKERDWINEREEKKPSKGRPNKIYSLKVGFNKIITQLETERKKADIEVNEKIKRLKKLVSSSNEIERKSQEYIDYFEKNKASIPNIERLVKILKSDKKPGHIVHAEFVKRLFEGGIFKVTDIEVKAHGTDVDIKLNDINLQIWHGASVSVYNVLKGKTSALGGVETDWAKDELKIKEKLNQLPIKEFGLLICYDFHMGIVLLPEWIDNIPDNKAICELFHTKHEGTIQNEARLYYSSTFKYSSLAEKVISALGFQNIMVSYG